MLCKKCNNIGVIIQQDKATGEDVAIMCDCWKKECENENTKNIFKKANLPNFDVGYTFDTFLETNTGNSNKNAITVLKNMIKNDTLFSSFRTIWIWSSDLYSGRTTIASLIGLHLAKKGINVKYSSAQSLVKVFTEFKTKDDFFVEFNKADVFILDDMLDNDRFIFSGKYSRIEFRGWLKELYDKGKFFICTSNRPLVPVTKNDIDIDNLYPEFKHFVSIFRKKAYVLELVGSITV